jgi:hypothetical protein
MTSQVASRAEAPSVRVALASRAADATLFALTHDGRPPAACERTRSIDRWGRWTLQAVCHGCLATGAL